jgi:hypothetical protein
LTDNLESSYKAYQTDLHGMARPTEIAASQSRKLGLVFSSGLVDKPQREKLSARAYNPASSAGCGFLLRESAESYVAAAAAATNLPRVSS